MHGSLDLTELLRLLLKKLWLILLVTLICFLSAFGVTELFMTRMYKSSIQMYVNNSAGSQGGSNDYYSIITAQKLTNTYAKIIQSDRVLDKVIATENLQYSAGRIRNMMTIVTDDETQIMEVAITSDNAQMSKDLVNAIADIAPGLITQVTKTGTVEILDRGKASATPTSPNLMINCIIGVLLGLFLSLLYIVLRDMLDLHVKGEEDIKKHYNIPVLGSIPVLNSQTKGGYQYYER